MNTEVNNDKSYFDLKEQEGLYYPIVKRKKGSLKIDECPYCGLQHVHTSGTGHRNSHCRDSVAYFTEINIKGKLIFHARGYFIEEY